MTDQRIRDPLKTTDDLGRSWDIKLLGLVTTFFFLTTVVLSTLLVLERKRNRLVARVRSTREVGSQAPTTYTHKSASPRFKPLPDFAHG